jgi:hypothetical protein
VFSKRVEILRWKSICLQRSETGTSRDGGIPMIQCIRILVAFLAVGFASAYYLDGKLDLSNTSQLLTFEEFCRDPRWSAVHAAQSGLDANAAAPGDLNAAYSSYLGGWNSTSPQPTISNTFVSPVKSRLHRLYAKIGSLLPTPRTKHPFPIWFTTENRRNAGMLVTLAGLLSLAVGFHFLSAWLRSLSR